MTSKNKEETKNKLIDAVGVVLVRDGFSKLGVNRIAKEAGVSKVLIYRYFGDLDTLVKAFVLKQDYWLGTVESSPIEDIKSPSDLRDWSVAQFKAYLRFLLEHKEIQEIHRWELLEKNPITEAIAKRRGEFGRNTAQGVSQIMNYSAKEIDAITSIITGGLLYLVLRSKTIDQFNSLDFDDDKTWERLEGAIEHLFSALLK